MKIEKKQDGNKVELVLEGRLDTMTAPMLREQIAGLPDDLEQITLDFHALQYISSAGLRELLVCRKRFPGDRMKVVGVSEVVFEIFETTGFDQIIPLELAE